MLNIQTKFLLSRPFVILLFYMKPDMTGLIISGIKDLPLETHPTLYIDPLKSDVNP